MPEDSTDRRGEFAVLADTLPDMIIRVDRDLRYQFVNRAMARLLGREPADFLGHRFGDFGMTEDVVRQFAERVPRTIDTGEPGAFAYRVATPIGPRDFDIQIIAERADEGHACALVIARDVTEQRRADAHLRMLAEAGRLSGASLDLDALLDALTGLGVPDLADGCVIDYFADDGTLVRRFGAARIPPELEADAIEILARTRPLEPGRVVRRAIDTRAPVLERVTAEFIARTAGHDPALVAMLRATGLSSVLVVPLLTHDEVLGALTFFTLGTGRLLQERDVPVAQALAERAAAAVRNAQLYTAERESAARLRAILAEREQLETQLLQAQKMEAVGRLAGGVAHDFNNLLTVISGCADFLLERLPPDDPAWGDANEVRRTAERGAVLTRQLLTFSSRQVVHPRDVDVRVLVRDAERLLRRLIGEDIELHVVIGAEPAVVHIDPGQLEQALVNLVVNARDAMPNGGRLTISAERAVPGDVVALAVRDTGVGMDDATRARIFEPFFTTKGPSRGTGLGLSTVFGIVQQAGGRVAVDSAPGKGSTFTLLLPLAARAAVQGNAAAAPPAGHGTETILLVEDDARVRTVARRALERYGYTVLEAARGHEALAVVDRWQGDIDLVLTDIVLPELNGRELVEAVQTSRPGVRALFMSGYTADARLHHRITELGAPFLEKPFTVEGLTQAVRAALDA